MYPPVLSLWPAVSLSFQQGNLSIINELRFSMLVSSDFSKYKASLLTTSVICRKRGRRENRSVLCFM